MIPDEAARERMRSDILRVIDADAGLPILRSGGGTTPPGTVWDPEHPHARSIPASVVDMVGEALAIIMGPIAPYLLRRASMTARTPEDLEAACAAMISDEDERARFARLLSERSRS